MKVSETLGPKRKLMANIWIPFLHHVTVDYRRWFGRKQLRRAQRKSDVLGEEESALTAPQRNNCPRMREELPWAPAQPGAGRNVSAGSKQSSFLLFYPMSVFLDLRTGWSRSRELAWAGWCSPERDPMAAPKPGAWEAARDNRARAAQPGLSPITEPPKPAFIQNLPFPTWQINQASALSSFLSSKQEFLN